MCLISEVLLRIVVGRQGGHSRQVKALIVLNAVSICLLIRVIYFNYYSIHVLFFLPQNEAKDDDGEGEEGEERPRKKTLKPPGR